MYYKPFKKIMTAFLCVMLCLTSVGTAFAQDVEYTIKEIDDMQLTIDSEMMAVTRSTDASDGYFSLNGNEYDKVMKSMKDGNIYLQATDSRQSILLSVTMFENDDTHKIDNYNRLSESELEKIVMGYHDNSQGTTYTASTVDEVAHDIVWIDFEFRASVGSEVFKQYQANTVVNGKNVSITMQRNGADVIASDYDVLKNVVSSVKFGSTGLPYNFILYVIIGAALLVIVILILVIIFAKRASRRRKQTKNDKIIRQLAGEYTKGRSTPRSEEPIIVSTRTISSDNSDETPADATRSFDISQARQNKYDIADRYDSETGDDYDYPNSRPVRSYSDEEIARLLGDTEDDENFTETLPVDKADSAANAEDVESVDSSLLISDFSEETNGAEKTVEEELAEIEAAKPLKNVRDIFSLSSSVRAVTNGKTENIAPDSEEPPVEESKQEEEPAEEQPEERQEPEEQQESEEQPNERHSTETNGKTDDASGGDNDEEEGESEQEALDDYNNDEVLVREEAKRNKFSESSDFFEEAPGKLMGFISREEIEDAEEFDVITEVEQKAAEVTSEPERRESSKPGVAKRFTAGLSSFGKHCGYFAVNVSREIKRGRAKKKRKKEEAERRQRAQQRQARQKIQSENGGLVQVKKRGERRPPQNRGK